MHLPGLGAYRALFIPQLFREGEKLFMIMVDRERPINWDVYHAPATPSRGMIRASARTASQRAQAAARYQAIVETSPARSPKEES